MEKEFKLVMNLDLEICDLEDIAIIVEKVQEIQKEYNCNCTLNVRIIS